jgi:hypothetical protein
MKNQIKFLAVFQLSRTEVFEVEYKDFGNQKPFLSTSCSVFNRSKTDYVQYGQCQKDILYPCSVEGKNEPDHTVKHDRYAPARNFFEFWDSYHLKGLSDELHEKLMKDVEILKEAYNHTYSEEVKIVGSLNGFGFHTARKLTMQNPKQS